MAAEKMTNGEAENAPAHDAPGAGPVDAHEQRYPDYLMDFPPDLSPEQVQHWQRFFDLREDILLDYGYQYCALLRRRKYSEATIRRRMVAWRKMEEKMKEG